MKGTNIDPAGDGSPSADVLAVLTESGALQRGHFLLTSGRHSDTYVEKFRLLERPELAGPLLGRLAEQFRDVRPQVVLSPAVGGIIVGYEIARHLGARAVFAEREAGRLVLRRGFQLGPGERCLVVEDVVTTGGSLMEVLAVAEEAGADIVGVGLLVDRSAGRLQGPWPIRALATVNAESWAPEQCPVCRKGIPLVQRGSRGLGR